MMPIADASGIHRVIVYHRYEIDERFLNAALSDYYRGILF